MRARAANLLLVGVVVGMVGCDHATKGLAEKHLRDREAVEVIPGVLDLDYVQNHGSAFGADRILPEPARAPVLLLGALAGMVAIVFLWRRRWRHPAWERVALGLLLAGAVGNLLDRLLRGYVVDFVRVPHWPVFNLADVCIFVGAALLALGLRRTGHGDPATGPT